MSQVHSPDDESLPKPQDGRFYTDGVFDFMHSGHFNAMRQASKLGKFLCTGVNSDEEVLRAKGAASILSTDERLHIMSHCRWVDDCLVAPYETSLDFLLNVAKCDYVCHGDDYVVGASGQDCYQEPREAGRFRVFKRTIGISSTAIICRLLLNAQHHGFLTAAEVQHIKRPPTVRRPIGSPLDARRLLDFIGKERMDNIELRGQKAIARQHRGAFNMGIVYCAGVFDVMRSQIVDFLEQAKEMGKYLIVGLYDDVTVQKLNGPVSPILSQTERMLNLYALRMVDEVILNAPLEPDDPFLARYGIETVVVSRGEDSPGGKGCSLSKRPRQASPKKQQAAFGEDDEAPDASSEEANPDYLPPHRVTVDCLAVNDQSDLLQRVAEVLRAERLDNISSRQERDGTNIAKGILVEF